MLRRWRIVAGVALVIAVVAGAGLLTVPVRCSPGVEDLEARPAPPPPSGEGRRIRQTVPGYARGEAGTYLAFAAWSGVDSAQAYAEHLERQPPSTFPYFAAIRQFWSAYCHAYGITTGRWGFALGEHLRLLATGARLSAGYLARGVYERSVGRFTEWLSGERVEEDAFAATVARDYAAWVARAPWYEFAFASRLDRLWRQTRLWGPHLVRKWERKGALTLEYTAKAASGWLVGAVARRASRPPASEIHVWATGVPAALLAAEPRIRRVLELGPGSAVLALPRGQAFTEVVTRMADQGVQIVEIAGNREILVTAVVPRDRAALSPGGTRLFAMPVLGRPHEQRVAWRAPVAALPAILRGLRQGGARSEHVYDY